MAPLQPSGGAHASGDPRAMVVGEVRREDAPQAPFVQHHDVVHAFPAHRADQPFRVGILPGRARRAPIGDAEVVIIAAPSRGLTGADLKAIVEDGKLLFAYDKTNGRLLRRVEDYFLEAIETVRANRVRYARRKGLQSMETVSVGFKVE